MLSGSPRLFLLRGIFLCLLLSAHFLEGQDSIAPKKMPVEDSLETVHYDSRFYFFEQRTRTSRMPKDSTFNQLPNYFPRSTMGNIGLPEYTWLLSFRQNDPLGVKWFSSPYDTRLLGLQDDHYYWENGIHTEIFGAAGSRKEQVLKLSHKQNLNERLNFSMKLNRYGADGFYQRQQSFVNNVLLSSNYISRKKRFGYFSSFSFDRFKHFENGGIVSDSALIADTVARKDLLAVQLGEARRNYSLLAGNAFLFFSLNRDSAAAVNHYILAGTKGSINKSTYIDNPAAGYYANVYLNPSATNDSTVFSKLSPSLSYNLNGRNATFELGAQYDWSEWNTSDSLQRYESFIAQQGFAWRAPGRRFVLKEKASYIFSGNNYGDYQVFVAAGHSLDFLETNFSLKAIYENRSPDLFFKYTSINNYFWENAFVKTQSAKLEAVISSAKLHLDLGAVYSNSTNFIALDSNALPLQFRDPVQAVRLFLCHHLKVFKFHLVNTIHYQMENSAALALPPLYTQHQLYFEHRVKRNGLKLQIGMQANYLSKTDLISYDPALNSFYLDYADEKRGNYVFADLFFNVYFKPVKLFFKAEHLNQGFSGPDYTLLRGYYQPDRSFRFGVSWEFWD